MSDLSNIRDHERWEGDAAAYALGSLEEHEVRPFEEHLAGCMQCQRDLAAMRTAVEALPAAAPAAAAPRELKERVMDTVRAEARPEAISPEAAEPAVPRRRARVPTPWRRWPSSALAGAATALAALAVVLGLTLAGGGGSGRTYAGIVYAPGASASVHVSGKSVILRFSRLPSPAADRIYQVWLKHGAQAPVATRALFATANGSVALPGSLHGVQAVLVTDEPRPHGSRAPTRQPIIVVRLA